MDLELDVSSHPHKRMMRETNKSVYSLSRSNMSLCILIWPRKEDHISSRKTFEGGRFTFFFQFRFKSPRVIVFIGKCYRYTATLKSLRTLFSEVLRSVCALLDPMIKAQGK